ncbi:MAG: hypothetical protein K0M70_08170 [Arenimonas sp.]|uniref:hypothetical protein n=1 Tax=Arenimonas sp. TaxID=1872635 RepID=UPI0025BE7B80|nr:hypothetical protein [Arenimonas sp.]MBW8367817.1 hypothetical protein [Arenimonas sp.]
MADAPLTSSDIIAMSSAVIALCALGISIWQGYVTRQHNVLSARPIIELLACLGDPEKDGIILKNAGPGPAIVRGITLTSDRVRFNLFSEHEFKKLLSAWTEGLSPTPTFGTLHVDDNTIIASGESVQFLAVNPYTPMAQLFLRLEEKFGGMEIDVEYECLYGKKHTSKYKRGVSNAA